MHSRANIGSESDMYQEITSNDKKCDISQHCASLLKGSHCVTCRIGFFSNKGVIIAR